MLNSGPIHLDDFYSSVPLDIWRQVLGDCMHYHHGIWKSDEDWETALENAVVSLARHVEPGSTVIDLGCGWGGPASVLKEQYGCSVLCVTVSQTQALYCASRNLEVRHANLEHEIPEGSWSVGWWMESLEHLERPKEALVELRTRCDKLVIRVNTCERGSQRLFGGSMPMRSTQYYLDALADASWQVMHLSNRRSESLRSPFEWLARLRKVVKIRPDNPHLRALWDYSIWFSTSPFAYAAFPLMDIVAE
jgi:Mycolic acid cyclopropane synthetase